MVVALAGIAATNLYLAAAEIFLLSTPAALFGPSKYGLLPELLPEKRLSWGNGILELGTFVAIIGGTAAGAVMAERFHGNQLYSGLLLALLGLVGLVASLGISRGPPA